jgi:hypothetical protein
LKFLKRLHFSFPRSEQLKQKIDELAPACQTFEDFIAALKSSGCTVRENRKHISVTLPGQKRAIRLNTLGGEYTEEAIRARLGMVRVIITGSDSGLRSHQPTGHVSLLVDIQAKIQAGKGRRLCYIKEGVNHTLSIFVGGTSVCGTRTDCSPTIERRKTTWKSLTNAGEIICCPASRCQTRRTRPRSVATA